jgi:type I restriction enzyme S subunit
MKAYPKYKSSGIDWIGDIPEHWIPKRLKYFCKICNGKDYRDIELEEGGYPVYGTGGIFARSEKYLHDKPSVLLGRKGTVDKPVFVKEPFWTSDTIYYTDIKATVNPKYFFYLSTQIKFDFYIYGSAVPSMTKEYLDNIHLNYPTLEEQTAIANFLDQKTAEIDQTISQKERLIELFEEEQKAMINQAVTKGLNPNVKMKPSGIEWLGDVPEGWEVIKIKRLIIVKDGTHETPAYVDESSYPLITSKDIKKGEIDFKNPKFISEEDYFNIIKRSDVSFNDIIMPMIGTIGNPVIVNTDKKFAIKNVALFKTSVSDCNTKYIYYMLSSEFMVKQLDFLFKGGVQNFVSLDILRNLIITRAPIPEQEDIVKNIEKNMNRTINAIDEIQKEIELLKEYRQALIFEAVTGKIDVRDELT